MRAVLPLSDEFQRQDLTITLQGWRAGTDQDFQPLPEGLRVSFPTSLPASEQPLLPVLVHSASPLGQLTSLQLRFLVRGSGPSMEIDLIVELAGRAVFELKTPERVLAFPDRPTMLPVRVRNTGNAAARAELSASGMAVSAPSPLVGPGRTATLNLELPALAGGQRQLTLTVSWDGASVSRTVTVSSSGGRPAGRYGVEGRLAIEGNADFGAGAVNPLGSFTVSASGRLSRITFIDVEATAKSTGAIQDARLLVRYGGSSLELDQRSQLSPAGDVGLGFYLSHKFDRLPLVDSLALGLAAPLNRERGPGRFGVSLKASRISSQLSLDLSASELISETQVNLAPFHASLRFQPDASSSVRASLQYATRPLGVQLQAEYGKEITNFTVGSRYSSALPTIGPLTYGLRLELMNGDPALLSLSAQGSIAELQLSIKPGSVVLDGDVALSLGPATVRLGAGVPLRGAGNGRLEARAAFPAGPLTFDSAASWKEDRLSAELEAGHSILLEGASLASEFGLHANDLLGSHQLTANAGISYVGGGALQGSARLAVPLLGEGDVSVSLAASYTLFAPTSPDLARILDGPDPTERQVRVAVMADGELQPLPGVRVIGCGTSEVTGSEGKATLRGRSGPCQISVDQGSLPSGTFLGQTATTLGPGESAQLTAVKTVELRGLVRYRDVDTGELLEGGPARAVRVLLEGPVSRWTNVSLPAGTFHMPDLPAGRYRASVVGLGVEEELTIGSDAEELLLTVPAPRRSVLDPASVTPPVRIDLGSLLVAHGEAIVITVSSPAQVERITVEVAGTVSEFDDQRAVDGPWRLEIPVPANASGAQNLELIVEFAGGQAASRTVQVIVTGSPAAPGSQ